jgi:hypothetical protein
VAIIPNGEGSLEVRQSDDGVEGGVDGAKAEDLGFGPAGGGAPHAWAELAEDGKAMLPEFGGRGVAAEEEFGSGGRPVYCAAELAGEAR